ncbi:hypothetical protein [Oricola indica]|jgi:hypothetical protein|uniref:hypothetical protein n=1 Tax=Oricola indica TaxID=2872591 RepID=UPI001CC18788|nr:hypothetical protein [Oricola indica]
MSVLAIRIEGKGMPRFTEAFQQLGTEKRAHSAYRRGVNRVGRKAFTATRRALAKQVGLSQTKTVALGNIRTTSANFQSLRFLIESTGATLSLKEFSAKQFGYGVRAKPWGRSQRFPHAFIFAGHPKSGRPVAGGHVFKRTGSSSLPIEKLWGPSIPKEIVKDESRDAFQTTARELPDRIRHEIRAMTKGAVT